MSKIADFKKRHLENKNKQAEQVAEKVASAPANLALALLAQLLNVDEENAIETAQQYIDRNISFFGVDHANGKDATVVGQGFIHSASKIDVIKPTNDVDELNAVKSEIESSADNVNESAANVDNAAASVNDAASDLAYTADDINSATENLKEATSELKKPLAEQKSSNSKKTEKQKNS